MARRSLQHLCEMRGGDWASSGWLDLKFLGYCSIDRANCEASGADWDPLAGYCSNRFTRQEKDRETCEAAGDEWKSNSFRGFPGFCWGYKRHKAKCEAEGGVWKGQVGGRCWTRQKREAFEQGKAKCEADGGEWRDRASVPNCARMRTGYRNSWDTQFLCSGSNKRWVVFENDGSCQTKIPIPTCPGLEKNSAFKPNLEKACGVEFASQKEVFGTTDPKEVGKKTRKWGLFLHPDKNQNHPGCEFYMRCLNTAKKDAYP